MDFHVHTPAGSQHVMTVHRDDNDDSPLQLISAQRLARLELLEAQQVPPHPLDVDHRR